MSRVADLADLVQSANDIYFATGGRDVRNAYIQIDQLCELVLKSWLQIHVTGWSPVSHNSNGRDFFKHFDTVVNEVKTQAKNTLSSTHDFPRLSRLLSRFEHRRINRNNFFHDHKLAGLTVIEKDCLEAYCDLFDLMELLFDKQYQLQVDEKPILRSQVAIIRLKMQAIRRGGRLAEYYRQALEKSRKKEVSPGSFGYDFIALYDDPGALYRLLKQYFVDELEGIQDVIDRIDNLKKRNREHKERRRQLLEDVQMIQDALNECLK